MDGLTITIIRTMRGMSQSELAQRVGITRTTISDLENGHRAVTQTYREKLRAIGINLDDPIITATIQQLQLVINGHPNPAA
ncbi:MAG: helix-turn-helix domain-containing protein [Chloroflexi bacterium]|nr:helix-turn-helix domain-containing protein [Chloroflexota bacterium]